MQANKSIRCAVQAVFAASLTLVAVAALLAVISRPTADTPPIAVVPEWESLSEPLFEKWEQPEVGLAPPPSEIEFVFQVPKPTETLATHYLGVEWPLKNYLLNTIGSTQGAGFVSRGDEARAQMIPVGCDSQIEYPVPAEAEQLDLAISRE